MKTYRQIIGFILLSASVCAGAAEKLISPYAGEEARLLKSLSSEDIYDLLNGRGWGLAKAAELNGVPGPAHLLEMKNEIALSAKQVRSVKGIWNQMNNDARRLGERYVALERNLNQQFSTRQMDQQSLRTILAEIASVRTDLRYTHLSAHLKTLHLLEPSQVTLYNRLRGYSSNDPCNAVPEGHNPDMWRKHHGCT